MPGAVLATATLGSFQTGIQTPSLNTNITISRGAWLTFSGISNQVYTRGTTDTPPARWKLGTTSSAPADATAVPRMIYRTSDVSSWNAISLGTKGFAIGMGLKSV
jgi:hypothetical protein